MLILHIFVGGNLLIKQTSLVQQALTNSFHSHVTNVQACGQAYQPAYM